MRAAAIIITLAGTVAAIAVAQVSGPGSKRTWTDLQNQTRTAGCNFTISDGGVDVNAGLDLTAAAWVRPSVFAPSGQVLDGGGTLRACYLDTEERQWVRVPDRDLSVTVNGPRQGWSDIEIGPPYGRAAYYTDGVNISSPDGGANIKVKLDAFIAPRTK